MSIASKASCLCHEEHAEYSRILFLEFVNSHTRIREYNVPFLLRAITCIH